MTNVFDQYTVKCRKSHRCCICNEVIKIGEKAVRQSGADEDGIYAIHMHPECFEVTKDWKVDDWECTSPGEVKRPQPPKEVL